MGSTTRRFQARACREPYGWPAVCERGGPVHIHFELASRDELVRGGKRIGGRSTAHHQDTANLAARRLRSSMLKIAASTACAVRSGC